MSSQPSLETLVGRLADEFIDRRHRGESPDIEELAARYPEHSLAIRQVLVMLQTLGQGGPPESDGGPDRLRGTASFAERRRIGDFELLGEIGRGGMGVVYAAKQVSLDRIVALKILPAAATLDDRQLRRFHNEARAAASLNHPSIVPVHFVGEEQGVHFYTMPLIAGSSLAQVVRRRRQLASLGNQPPADVTPQRHPADVEATTEKDPPTTDRALSLSDRTPQPAPPPPTFASVDDGNAVDWFETVARWGIQIGEALDYAHEAGVLHRDIKPSNLLLDTDGRVWVTDFGLARVGGAPDLTHTGDLVGTLRYMSPEQAGGERGVATERSDLYALGATLYELLTLRPLVPGEERVQLLRDIVQREVIPLRRHDRRIPEDLEKIVLKAVAKSPELRYASARELAADLRRFLEHVPVVAQPPSWSYRGAKWLQRNQRLVWSATGLLAAALLMVVVTLMVVWRQSGDTRRALGIAEKALQEKETALREKDVAYQRERQLRYIQDIKAAGQLRDTGSLRQIVPLLRDLEPGPGDRDLRGFEWHWLRRLTEVPTGGVKVSAAPLYHVAFSPDSERVATCGEEPRVRIYDAKSLNRIAEHDPGQGEVNSVDFSPDGQLLATAGDDGTVIIWDWRTWKQQQKFHLYKSMAYVAKFSHNGAWLAVCGDEHEVCLLDLRSGTPPARLDSHAKEVDCIAFSADSRLLAAGGENGRVLIWDLEKPEDLQRISGHQSAITEVDFVGASTSIVSTSDDRDARIVKDAKSESEWVATGSYRIHALGVHPGGEFGVMGDGGGILTSFSVTGEPLEDARRKIAWTAHDGDVNSICFSPDGSTLASVGDDGWLRLWPEAVAPFVYGFSELDMRFEFLPEARDPEPSPTADRATPCRVVAGTPRGLEILTVDGSAPPVLLRERTGPQEGLYSIEVSADGSTLAVASQVDREQRLEVWDLPSRKPRWGERLMRQLSIMAISRNGDEILLQGPDRTLQVRDARNGRVLFQKRVAVDFRAVWSPDERYLVTSDDEWVEMVDWRTRAIAWSRPLGPFDIGRIAFSVGGDHLWCHLTGHSLQTWESRSGKELRMGDTSQPPMGMPQLSRDGRTLAIAAERGVRWTAATAERSVQLWNVAENKLMLTLDTDPKGYSAIRFTADGRYLGYLYSRDQLVILDCGVSLTPGTSSDEAGSSRAAAGRHEHLGSQPRWGPAPAWHVPRPADSVRGHFGLTVAVGKEYLLVGDPRADVSGVERAGRVLKFDRDDWKASGMLVAPKPTVNEEIGAQMATEQHVTAGGNPRAGSGGRGILRVFLEESQQQNFERESDSGDAGVEFAAGLDLFEKWVVAGSPGGAVQGVRAGVVEALDVDSGVVRRRFEHPKPEEGDRFGVALRMSESGLVVGAPGRDVAHGGEVYRDAGVAYCIDAEGNEEVRFELPNPEPGAGDGFGSAVAVFGVFQVIAAPTDDGSVEDCGRVFVFDSNTGRLLHTLSSPNPLSGERFGASVDVMNTTIAVGAPGHRVNGVEAGAVYLFDGLTGRHLETLLNPQPALAGGFGSSLSLNVRELLIGAPLPGTAGKAGEAYLYRRKP